MSDKIKLQHFRNLVSLSAADGKIDEREKNTLVHLAKEHGIALDRLELMLKYAHEYVYLIPQNQLEKEKQLKEMIDLALIDGEFASAEYELIQMVSERLGFTQNQLNRVIADIVGQGSMP